MNPILINQKLLNVQIMDMRRKKVVSKIKMTFAEMVAANQGYVANLSDLRIVRK